MRIDTQKADNLEKLLGGLSLLDNQDQERIISVINALDFAEKKVEKETYANIPLTLTEKQNLSNGDKLGGFLRARINRN